MIHDDLVRLIARPDPTIIEVGSNDGRDALVLARRLPLAQIFCFEPDPRAAERFRRLVDLPNIQLHRCAIGRERGRTKFYASSGRPPAPQEEFAAHGWPDDWDLSGSIRRPTGHLDVTPWCKFEEAIEVEVTTLDTFIAEQGIKLVDLIWADTQGAEEDLIRGAADTLRRTRFLYTEYSNRELYQGQIRLDEIVAMLPDFEVIEILANDVLLRNITLADR